MIADMLSDKKLNLIVNEIFTRGRKPNVILLFKWFILLLHQIVLYVLEIIF